MVIDCHAHVTAPQQLWAYRALLLANRGVDGPKKVEMTDEEIQFGISGNWGKGTFRIIKRATHRFAINIAQAISSNA